MGGPGALRVAWTVLKSTKKKPECASASMLRCRGRMIAEETFLPLPALEVWRAMQCRFGYREVVTAQQMGVSALMGLCKNWTLAKRATRPMSVSMLQCYSVTALLFYSFQKSLQNM